MFICEISVLNKFGKILLDQMLSPMHFGWRKLVVILVLSYSPGCSQSYLTEFLQTDKGNVTKLINRMVHADYIERRINPQDKRYRKLYLRARGEALVPALEDILKRWEDICLTSLDEEQKATYRQLNKLVMDQMLAGIPPVESDGDV